MTILEDKLEKMTGFDQFKPGQEDSLQALMDGDNVIGILPTGGGKSLIYQLYQYQEPGITIIVSPLISLMQDQVGQLQKLGFGSGVALNSSYDRQEQQYILSHLSQYQFLFISPEMILKPAVLQQLSRINIRLLVVDEAHCISQWGFDFRPQYTELKKVRAVLGFPQTLALSATASQATLDDIQEYLFKEDEIVELVKESVDRQNIFYLFEEVTKKENKVDQMLAWLDRLPKPGIVYVHHKSELEELNELVKNQTDLKTATYHGDRSLADRHIIQNQFLHQKLDVVFATSAFGMGINHPHIRFVLHYHMPKDLSDFVQEIGRAGRDQDQAVAVVLYDASERARLQHIRQFYEDEGDLLATLLDKLFSEGPQNIQLDQYSETVSAMLQFYHSHFSDSNLAKAHAETLQQAKLGQIYQMLNLMNHQGCYRSYLLAQAEEVLTEKPSLCCSNCNLNYSEEAQWQSLLALPNRLEEAQDDTELTHHWKERLQQLFVK